MCKCSSDDTDNFFVAPVDGWANVPVRGALCLPQSISWTPEGNQTAASVVTAIRPYWKFGMCHLSSRCLYLCVTVTFKQHIRLITASVKWVKLRLKSDIYNDIFTISDWNTLYLFNMCTATLVQYKEGECLCLLWLWVTKNRCQI